MAEDSHDYLNYCSGSSDFDLRTLQALARPYNLTWGEEFFQFYSETLELLKRLFRTQNELFALVGTIRAAWDMALCSLIEPGDRVLVPTNGGYWHNFAAAIIETYGGIAVLPKGSPRQPIKPELVSDALEEFRDVKLVMAIHVDTDGGIVNPYLEEIGQVIREKSDALYVVDAATSLAADDVNVDAWGADICFSGSHKGLSSPAGLAFMTVSEAAQRRIAGRTSPIRGWYGNLLTWKEVDPLATAPGKIGFSLPWPILRAVRSRLDYIFSQGLEETIKEHEVAARAIRNGLQRMGLELYPACAKGGLGESSLVCRNNCRSFCANSMTYVRFPTGVEPEAFETEMARRYGIVTISQPYNQDGFIIGTINSHQVHPRNLLACLTATGLAMKRLGAEVSLEGLDAAAEVLRERPDLGSKAAALGEPIAATSVEV